MGRRFLPQNEKSRAGRVKASGFFVCFLIVKAAGLAAVITQAFTARL
jgi:hypothetical protein